jgi:hypothetical protein
MRRFERARHVLRVELQGDFEREKRQVDKRPWCISACAVDAVDQGVRRVHEIACRVVLRFADLLGLHRCRCSGMDSGHAHELSRGKHACTRPRLACTYGQGPSVGTWLPRRRGIRWNETARAGASRQRPVGANPAFSLRNSSQARDTTPIFPKRNDQVRIPPGALTEFTRALRKIPATAQPYGSFGGVKLRRS